MRCRDPPQVLLDKESADGTRKWLIGGIRATPSRPSTSRQGSRHPLRVIAGRLRAELHVLLHRHAGVQPQPVDRRDHRPGVLAARALGNVPHQQRRLTNVVMMGMGEPLANFDNVVRAMSIMRDDLELWPGNKRVTLSTAGMVPMIDRLAAEATCRWRSRCTRRSTRLRSELVPLNRKYPIAELMDACVRYATRKKASRSLSNTL